MGPINKMSPELLFSCVMLGLIGMVTVITNFLVLRTMIVCDRIRNSLFVVCSGIAFADILYIVLAVPVEIINNSQEPSLVNKRLCKTISYLTHTAHYVCIYLIVGLTIVRAIFLTTRIAPGPTALKGLAATITCWVIGLLINIPMLDNDIEPMLKPGNCLLPGMIDYRSAQFTYVSIALSYGIPVGLMAIVYAVTYILCRRYCDNTHSDEDKRMARLVTRVIVTFAFFWLPLHLIVIITLKHYQENIEGRQNLDEGVEVTTADRLFTALNFLWALTQIDKLIRPLIYMGTSIEFRNSYNEIIDCTLCCNEKKTCNNNSLSQSQLEPLNAAVLNNVKDSNNINDSISSNNVKDSRV